MCAGFCLEALNLLIAERPFVSAERSHSCLTGADDLNQELLACKASKQWFIYMLRPVLLFVIQSLLLGYTIPVMRSARGRRYLYSRQNAILAAMTAAMCTLKITLVVTASERLSAQDIRCTYQHCKWALVLLVLHCFIADMAIGITFLFWNSNFMRLKRQGEF